MRFLLSLILAVIVVRLWPVGATLNRTLVYQSFLRTFPLSEGSSLLVEEGVLTAKALQHIQMLGVPDNITQFRAQSDGFLIDIIMQAALGSLGNNTRGETEALYMIVADPTTGTLRRVDSLTHNRILVFEVMVFALLLALTRAWYLLKVMEGEHVKAA